MLQFHPSASQALLRTLYAHHSESLSTVSRQPDWHFAASLRLELQLWMSCPCLCYCNLHTCALPIGPIHWLFLVLVIMAPMVKFTFKCSYSLVRPGFLPVKIYFCLFIFVLVSHLGVLLLIVVLIGSWFGLGLHWFVVVLEEFNVGI